MENTIPFAEYIVKFRGMIKDLGLNNSNQREYVLEYLYNSHAHHSAEEIQEYIRDEFKTKIGIATVYKVLNLFEKLGIVYAFTIEGHESKVYEFNRHKHHDHLICEKCGKIVEFVDSDIENIQIQIALKNKFRLTNHSMILYGVCGDCEFAGGTK